MIKEGIPKTVNVVEIPFFCYMTGRMEKEVIMGEQITTKGIGGDHAMPETKEQIRRENWSGMGKPDDPWFGAEIFAGRAHGLVLTQDGDLYGIGENTVGQIADTDKRYYRKACLMDRHVISAAAGDAYSIYVTEDGRVHFQGNGVFAERFKGFENASRVGVSDAEDIYYIQDRNGRWYVFGRNTGWRICPQIREKLADLPDGRLQLIRYDWQGLWGVSYGADGYSTQIAIKKGVYPDIRDTLLLQAVETEAYREQLARWGGENLFMDTCLLESKETADYDKDQIRSLCEQDIALRYGAPDRRPLFDQSTSKLTFTVYEETHKMAFYYENRHIYDPLPCAMKEEKRAWPFLAKKTLSVDKYYGRYLMLLAGGKCFSVEEDVLLKWSGELGGKPLSLMNPERFLEKKWQACEDRTLWHGNDVKLYDLG